MDYQAEFNFVQELLKPYRLQIHLIDSETTPDLYFARQSRISTLLAAESAMKEMYQRFRKQCLPHVVYQINDGLLRHHIAFLLPVTEEKNVYAHIGPYLSEAVTKQQIGRLAEKYHLSSEISSQIEAYYQETPFLTDETPLLSIIYTFCAHIWGGMDNFTTKQFQDFSPVNFDNLLKFAVTRESGETSPDTLYVEERYDMERQLMMAVSIGQLPKAELLFSTLSKYQFETRSSNALRNSKNYLIVLNTLLRVAARGGDVPPFHIDRISSAYAHKIEALPSAHAANALMKEMVRKYCLLVKNHSMKGYSLLIRKVLTQIDYDLTADLGLKNLAASLSVNPSYLSTLFKKETGSTLTEYVNQKRIEHAVFLLNSTSLQIQMIAQYSGITDVNYFTKTFKKIIGITPKEYRDRLSNPF